MITRPFQSLTTGRELVRQFTPNWFTATMGTGILALALIQLPFAGPRIESLAEAIWRLNIGLFALCCVLYGARWAFFFDGARRVFGHSTMCMFFGAIPMGLATIINGVLAFGIPRWGSVAIDYAQTLWWLDVALAVACGTLVPFLMFTEQDHSLERMTAVWLLPLVASEVAAATGGLLLGHLPPSPSASRILVLSYGLWGMSVFPALGVLVLLFMRLVLHKLPPREMAVTCWLALGPIGTGALGLMSLGAAAPAVLAGHDPANLGRVAQSVGVIGATILWGYGLWWFALASLITLRYLRDGLPFNMGWWAFTFPIGVYAVASLTLSRQTGVAIYADLGVAGVGLLVFFWVVVTARTAHGAWLGHLFVAPCLAAMPVQGQAEPVAAPASLLPASG